MKPALYVAHVRCPAARGVRYSVLTERSKDAELGYSGLLMRAEDFFALGQTQERYELVNGVVLMSPSPHPNHWRLIEEILFQVQAFARPNGGFDTYSETDLYLDDQTVL